MFSAKEVGDYYDQTHVHYEKWWGLRKNLSLHYGIWDENTRTFEESLANTNAVLLEKAGIRKGDNVLDAGCGVGGAAFFIHKEVGAKVTGLSLSKKQLAFAQRTVAHRELDEVLNFQFMDFTQTTFPAESFDVVWACESVCHTPDKNDFIKEAYRLLKKGGRLIMSDFFLTEERQEDKHEWITKWGNTWGVPNFVSASYFASKLDEAGFSKVDLFDYTRNIKKSARRMYAGSLMGAIPSELYNLFHPRVTRFAKSHYKCGYYQYKALQEDLWKYKVVLAVK
ncbi:methyltransferase domain-containing protein [Flammeovirgaceae bacterium SG7u.111]|nr:methyltransferase domain-containing protein [Flammeovirgaceae bacterium SG7u.132]WPO38370.1 methyltransferase domain-containing protein [Flammeovirgaceae bacterium SG7u.111]